MIVIIKNDFFSYHFLLERGLEVSFEFINQSNKNTQPINSDFEKKKK